ncbi:hypothetical protein elemo19C_phanotate51 [Flavobacterium phage vB_FspP_elemoA_1-9C]|uniref:Uncharacterized protein n=6 Tax=Elemovirus TaxID=2948694 RepID=A0A7D7FBD7_9CAUD|nr:hypothetical protein KNV10_gp60 [Flavobacterium phage vB_FspP_elemoA_7-9A]YP_010108956.1 hypothetical protein KNV11_gp57 [Flavobacterium phage vB_FspP_elemoF_6-3D]YP_010109044.1 hypothetical protein KNV12_gp57 [Flavobacterium phage vB_FspP_elemoE_6-9C]YP_010109108.1 hypothetical protein KNV13_gp25 [Flavobacterium phage vB_FspP_elemoD_13-5B]YP_010356129.1 hypothetical protein M1M19_gp60 [Flavobacterium phage vB_FspP_elemoB_14-3B]YP_010356489.1 hypothetical protein M1M21_gp59 [Flavobacterium 
MCTILLCVTCDQLTYNTWMLAYFTLTYFIVYMWFSLIVYYIMYKKEHCFILTLQI